MRKTKIWLISGCTLFAASFLLMMTARNIEGFAQWYATTIYPVLVQSIGGLSGLVPFSVVEILLYIAIILFLMLFGRLIIGLIKKSKDKRTACQFEAGLFLSAGILFFMYVINCGINYQRDSFSECIGLDVEEYTVEDLKKVCQILTEDINERAQVVERDDQGLMLLPEKENKLAVQAMKALAEDYDEMEGYYPQPKGLLGSWILSVQQLTGVYSPFTIEANYNQAMTAYNIPFTMCHELSHLRGFMQEQEANFIAYLACMESENVEFQYSGSMLGWINCTNVLYEWDREAWMEVREMLDENVLADLQANNEFWAKYDGEVAEVADIVNDNYLKANGQADGVKSYDRMVDLLVAYYR